MAKKGQRFIEQYNQHTMAQETKILVDRETGVNYLFHHSGYAGGLTPLLDREGKPIITPVYDED